MDLLIVTNAPGEISTWVRPVARAIKGGLEGVRISCLLLICQFASGEEVYLLRQIQEIDHILPISLYPRVFLKGRLPFGKKKGVVLHLGGDPVHSLVLAKRLGWRVLIYTYGPPRRVFRYFDRVMVLDEKAREDFVSSGIPMERMDVVGDLITDSVEPSSSSPSKEGIIGLLPGSRREHFVHLLPLLIRVCDLLHKTLPSYKFLLLVAKSIERDWSIKEDYIETPSGVRIGVMRDGIEVMKGARLVITIPGSNTGQLAALGVPMLVILPLHLPHLIPMQGVIGLIGQIPLFGRHIKGYLIEKAKEGFIALPNIRAHRFIVPEMKGILDPDRIAMEALKYIENLDRERVSFELKAAMGPKGASTKVARVVYSMMEG